MSTWKQEYFRWSRRSRCSFITLKYSAFCCSEGVTAHHGDVDSQIAYTLRIVEAILKSRGMDFSDVTRGNAYFRDSAGAGSLEENALRHGLPVSRLVVSQNDVCRDDLLFELEIDAAKVNRV